MLLIQFLSYTTEDYHPTVGPPSHRGTTYMVWALPHQSLIKKMPYRPVFNLTLKRYFPKMLSNQLAGVTAQVRGFNYAPRGQNRSWSGQMVKHKLKT